MSYIRAPFGEMSLRMPAVGRRPFPHFNPTGSNAPSRSRRDRFNRNGKVLKIALSRFSDVNRAPPITEYRQGHPRWINKFANPYGFKLHGLAFSYFVGFRPHRLHKHLTPKTRLVGLRCVLSIPACTVSPAGWRTAGCSTFSLAAPLNKWSDFCVATPRNPIPSRFHQGCSRCSSASLRCV